MSWECGCGIVNKDSRAKCSGCGTPKGMVWTREGFKPPDEAAALGDTVIKTLPYTGGGFFIFFSIMGAFRALAGLSVDPVGSIVMAFLLVLGAIAAAVQRPWAWYTLLTILILELLLFVTLVVSVILLGDSPQEATWAIDVVFSPVVTVLWFIYFYRRRYRFGAKGRWKWIQRTFPHMEGPEIPSESSPSP
jgi:hypothetical protein